MDLESMRKSPAYAPVGVILATFASYALKKLVETIPCVDAVQLKRTLLALMFSGAYFYTWTTGANPHDAEIKENILADEVPLILAAGYYLSHIYPQRFPSISAHHFFSVLSIVAVIGQGKGAGVANTFGFLVEAPNVFLALRGCIAKLESRCFNTTLNLIYSVIFISAKFVALGYHSYLILTNDEVTLLLKIFTFKLTFFSLSFLCEIVYHNLKRKKRNTFRERRKSRTRSKSRNRQRSSSSTARKCRR